MNNVSTQLFQAQAENLITLPEPLIAARDKAESISLALRKVSEAIPSPLAVEEEAASRVVSDPSSFASDPARVADDAVAALNAETRLRSAQRILSMANEKAERALAATLNKYADAIVANHLRPVVEKTLSEVRRAAPVLNGLDLTDAHLGFAASEKVRNAFRTLDEATVRYQRLRGLHSKLMGTDQRYFEDLARYAEIKDIDRLVPRHAMLFGPAPRLPWPDHPMGRLLWLIEHGADLWTPSRTELELYVSEMEQERQRNSPIVQVERPTLESPRTGDRRGFPRKGKWVESASGD